MPFLIKNLTRSDIIHLIGLSGFVLVFIEHMNSLHCRSHHRSVSIHLKLYCGPKNKCKNVFVTRKHIDYTRAKKKKKKADVINKQLGNFNSYVWKYGTFCGDAEQYVCHSTWAVLATALVGKYSTYAGDKSNIVK